jgi:lipopolysaccharide heptosyltransferase I
MPEPRFLIERLGSLGDIIHTLPAVHALRRAFSQAKVDWVVESKWLPLLDGNPDLNEVIALDRTSWGALRTCVRRLRSKKYDTVLDFQGLYKSAVLGWLSGAKERIGFDARFAREGGAARFYTKKVVPQGAHVIEQNLSLAGEAGAGPAALSTAEFPLRIAAEAAVAVEKQLAARGVRDYFVLSPGGGWASKCWPAERYGHLHRRLLALPQFAGMRGVVNFGPGERKLAEAVRLVAGEPEPVLLPLDLPQLMAMMSRAKFFVGGDTGPLHLAVALGVPVVGLYGPTDPARNGPCRAEDVVVRNARPEETTYKREDKPHPAMLSINVEQAVAAVETRLRQGR